MRTFTLQAARDYEAAHTADIPPADRPAYHLCPRIGWMNDPNGFCWYNGMYHISYQYYPYATNWRPMHWGHAVSKDLIHWQYLPAALAPEAKCDSSGCFSGSALTLPDGRHLLMYTGVRKETDDEMDKGIQNLCLALGDGENYTKYPLNPVLTGADLPEGFSEVDFRDPKIWQEEDGSYSCVTGCRAADGSGAILLFRSPDAFHWHFRAILDCSRNEYGRMWECPDFFPLGGKHLILTSPQDMDNVGMEFHNGNGVVCIAGDYNPKTDEFFRQSIASVDYGLDFYATQTTLAPDGRRLMIAWMQNWDALAGQPSEWKWFGQLTFPRELEWRDDRLIQRPARELDELHGRRVGHRHVRVHEESTLAGVYGRVADMTVRVYPKPGASYGFFRIKFAKGSRQYTSVSYRPDSSVLHLSRAHSGLNRDFVHERECQVRDRGGELELRILLDRYSAEIFVNGGEQTLTTVIYTPQTADGISFESDGEVLVDVEKYDLIL